MPKYLVVNDEELIYLHCLIMYYWDYDGRREQALGFIAKMDVDMMHNLEEKVLYNFHKPDRTGENAAIRRARELADPMFFISKEK
jgi:hypothetical protein